MYAAAIPDIAKTPRYASRECQRSLPKEEDAVISHQDDLDRVFTFRKSGAVQTQKTPLQSLLLTPVFL